MSDFLVRLGANKTASAVVRGLGLPLPLPQELDRAQGPWEAQPLARRVVLLHAGSDSSMAGVLTEAIVAMGADTRDPAAADNVRPHALVFDATGFSDPADLDELYRFFHDNARALNACGRAVVVARPPAETPNALARAARRAIEGFVRSMGKEIGRKGSTAQTLYVESGAQNRVEPALRFLLTNRSAFVSGQPVRLSGKVPLAGDFPREQPLAGKVALVTGSARGIGEATARALAREGAHVIVMDRPSEMDAAQAVAQSIGGTALACDITSADAVEIIKANVAQHHQGLDIVIHNAGVTRDKMLVNMDESRWNMVLDINLRSLIRVNEALLETLREGGRIVCLSSIGGIAGNAGQTNYAASKAGVIGYIEGLAEQLATRGITVNAIAPGFIETQMTAQMPIGPREVGRRLSSLGQGGQPEDVAEAITFLASPGAAGLTGQVLRVCGGSFIGA